MWMEERALRDFYVIECAFLQLERLVFLASRFGKAAITAAPVQPDRRHWQGTRTVRSRQPEPGLDQVMTLRCDDDHLSTSSRMLSSIVLFPPERTFCRMQFETKSSQSEKFSNEQR